MLKEWVTEKLISLYRTPGGDIYYINGELSMTEVITLEAELRETAGKGAARADRKKGLIPIVVYGNKQPAVSLTVNFNEVLRLLNKGGFKHANFEIKAGKETYKAKLQAMQLHPVRHQPIHMDFLRAA